MVNKIKNHKLAKKEKEIASFMDNLKVKKEISLKVKNKKTTGNKYEKNKWIILIFNKRILLINILLNIPTFCLKLKRLMKVIFKIFFNMKNNKYNYNKLNKK